jgi:hypothetical protein
VVALELLGGRLVEEPHAFVGAEGKEESGEGEGDLNHRRHGEHGSDLRGGR